jgi:hypothetical protein
MSPGFSVTQAALKTSLPSEEGSLQVPSSQFTGNANMQRSANYLALEVRVLNSPPKMPCDRPCVVFKPIKVCDEGMDSFTVQLLDADVYLSSMSLGAYCRVILGGHRISQTYHKLIYSWNCSGWSGRDF